MSDRAPITTASVQILLRIIHALRTGQTVSLYPSPCITRNKQTGRYNQTQIKLALCPIERDGKTWDILSRSLMWKGPEGMTSAPTDASSTSWSHSAMNEWSLNDYLDDIGWTLEDHPEAFSDLPAIPAEPTDTVIAGLIAATHGQAVTLPYFGEITFNADTGFHYYQSDNAERFRHDTCAGLIAGHTIQKG